jgi:PAS domain S-box-containing protein
MSQATKKVTRKPDHALQSSLMAYPVENYALNSTESYDLSLFFELSPDLLCIAGYDGYFRHVNPTVCRVLGYSYEELMAEPIDSFIHPEDRQLTSRYRDNLRQGTPLMNYENRYLTRDGEAVWLTWTSIPIPDKKQIYAIAKQVSHKKRLEADRNQLLTQLTRINTELKKLTYTTSHDLRAPVNNLIAIFSLLDPTRIPDPENRQYIDLLRF